MFPGQDKVLIMETCNLIIIVFYLGAVVQEIDVMELEKRYWTLKSGTKTGKFDLETFTPLVSPPIPQCLCPGMLCTTVQ